MGAGIQIASRNGHREWKYYSIFDLPKVLLKRKWNSWICERNEQFFSAKNIFFKYLANFFLKKSFLIFLTPKPKNNYLKNVDAIIFELFSIEQVPLKLSELFTLLKFVLQAKMGMKTFKVDYLRSIIVSFRTFCKAMKVMHVRLPKEGHKIVIHFFILYTRQNEILMTF